MIGKAGLAWGGISCWMDGFSDRVIDFLMVGSSLGRAGAKKQPAWSFQQKSIFRTTGLAEATLKQAKHRSNPTQQFSALMHPVDLLRPPLESPLEKLAN